MSASKGYSLTMPVYTWGCCARPNRKPRYLCPGCGLIVERCASCGKDVDERTGLYEEVREPDCDHRLGIS